MVECGSHHSLFNNELVHCPVLKAAVREVTTNDNGDLLDPKNVKFSILINRLSKGGE